MLSIQLLLAVLPSLVAAATSNGCNSKTAAPALNQRHDVTLSKSNRTYMYFLPKKYDQSKPNPLILSLHGASRTSNWQADLDRLTDPLFNEDHVVVYPQAEQYGKNESYIYWQGSPNATANDVEYISNVLDEVEKSLCIDTSRVYATGKSQGAGMVGVLACDSEASQRIAAFAPVSGAFYTTGATSDLKSCGDPKTLALTCHPGRDAIPVLDFHGGNDTTININGGLRNGGCLPNIRYWVAKWAQRNNLTASPSAVTSLNGSAQKFQYGTGTQQGLVTFVYDGDHVNHDWPATVNNSDNWAHASGPASFNASSLIMDFFAKYTLPEDDADSCDDGTSTTATVGSSTTDAATAPFTILTSTSVPTGASSSVVKASTSAIVATTAASTTASATSSVPTSGASRAGGLQPGDVGMSICAGFLLACSFFFS